MQSDLFILNLYKKYSRTFVVYLKLTLERCSEEDIHQLRVSIKRIKALFKIIAASGLSKSTTNKFFMLYSGIFNAAGKVREIEINLNLLNKMDLILPSALIKDLEKTLKASKNDMLAEVRNFSKNKLYRQNSFIYKKLNHLHDRDILFITSSIFDKKSAKVRKLLDGNYEEIKLHNIRKNLRFSGEIQKVMSGMDSNERLERVIIQQKEIRDYLGIWHDYDVLSNYVENYVKIENDHSDHLRAISAQVFKEKELLKDKAIDLLNSFYKSDLPLSF